MTDLAPAEHPAYDVAPAAPEISAYQEQMAEIWCDVLGRRDIGMDDDFFDLDGNSMHAIKVIHRIREQYGVDIRAIDFFESPTVASLAATVAAQSRSDTDVIEPRSPDAEPVLSLDQQRLWLADQLRPDNAYNIHGRRRLLGPLDANALSVSIATIMRRHETLRTRLPDLDGEPLQVVDELDEHWQLPIDDVSDADDPLAAAIAVADADALGGFDLAHGPLFRPRLIRLDDADHVLSITAHHTVCDDWSVSLFVAELAALYRVGGDVDRADLPELPIQYRDFAVWQQRHLSGDAAEQHLAYWRDQLAGAPAESTLAPVGPTSTATGGRIRSVLIETDTSALHGLCRLHDVTLFMALLAGLTAVLARRTGQSDLVIGVPITGREASQTKNLIGLFFNIVPIRVDTGGDPTWRERLQRARDSALGAYAHADVPLDLIVRRLEPARSPDRTPLFQVVLNVVDRAATDGLAHLDDQPMDSPITSSKLDLIITGRELDGRLLLELEFDPSRYAESAMWTLLNEVTTELLAAAAEPTVAPVGVRGPS